MTVGKVITEASMSLDAFIAKQDNTIGRLFDWLQNGDVEIPTPAKDFSVHLTPQTAEHWRRWTSQLGALVVGRTLFDFVDGWNGRHTLDVPVVVVTHQIPTEWVESHPDAPFSFVKSNIVLPTTSAPSCEVQPRQCSALRGVRCTAKSFAGVGRWR
jgi:dihydrofolate reductase